MRLKLKCGFEVLKQMVNSPKHFADEKPQSISRNFQVFKLAVMRVRTVVEYMQPVYFSGRVRETGIPVRAGYRKDRIVLLAPPCNPVVVAVDSKNVISRVTPVIHIPVEV